MKVKAHILKKVVFRREISGYRFPDYLNDPDIYNNYSCITCLLYYPDKNLVYCGMTAFNNDLLYAFDPENGQFRSCGYRDVAEKYEIKIHHSLELDADGIVYGATGGLHDIDEYLKSPGGSIFKFDPSSGQIEKIAVPLPHIYIQSLTLDKKRKILYGTTSRICKFFKYDLETQQTHDLGLINTEPEHSALDDEGCFWGSWLDTCQQKLKLFRYDPENEGMEHFDFGIPSTPVTLKRYGKPHDNEIDRLINGEDGYLYLGTELGMFFRLDPKNREIKYLGKPCVELRLPALAMGKNGLIYGAGGDGYQVEAFAFDREKERFYDLGRIYDEELDEFCYRPHDICIDAKGNLFVAETDTPKRTAYLWECRLDS